jgi:hypothetical protein
MYRLGLATLLTFIGVTFVSDITNSGVLACGMNRDESQILLIDKAWSRAAENKDMRVRQHRQRLRLKDG